MIPEDIKVQSALRWSTVSLLQKLWVKGSALHYENTENFITKKKKKKKKKIKK